MQIKKFLAVPAVLTVLALSASTVGAQVIGPRVALQFATNGLTNPLSASSTNAVIARLLLDTTGSTEAVRISSLPFNLVTGGGASASSLMNCRVYNESDLSTSLNTPASATTTLFEGVNNISFNSALILQPNTLTTVSLRCDVGNLTSGSTFTVNMNTANVVATGASTGIAAAVTIRGAVVIPPVVIVPPVTPGLPTTGAAGQTSQNVAMIAASLLMASLGFAYLRTKEQS